MKIIWVIWQFGSSKLDWVSLRKIIPNVYDLHKPLCALIPCIPKTNRLYLSVTQQCWRKCDNYVPCTTYSVSHVLYVQLYTVHWGGVYRFSGCGLRSKHSAVERFTCESCRSPQTFTCSQSRLARSGYELLRDSRRKVRSCRDVLEDGCSCLVLPLPGVPVSRTRCFSRGGVNLHHQLDHYKHRPDMALSQTHIHHRLVGEGILG